MWCIAVIDFAQIVPGHNPCIIHSTQCSTFRMTNQREYAYGPTNGLPDSKFGTFTQSLMDEAKKSDWKVIFPPENR